VDNKEGKIIILTINFKEWEEEGDRILLKKTF